MAKVFITHSMADHEIASVIKQSLKQRFGHDVKVYDDITPSNKDFDGEIRNALERADCVIALLTRKALDSVLVMQEVRIAAEISALIVVRLEDVDLSELAPDLLQYRRFNIARDQISSDKLEDLDREIQFLAKWHDSNSKDRNQPFNSDLDEDDQPAYPTFLERVRTAIARTQTSFADRINRIQAEHVRLATLGALGLGLAGIAFNMTSTAPPASARALSVAVASTDAELSAVGLPSGKAIIYRGDRRLGVVRGHEAPIVEVAFVDNDRAVLTLDADGQARRTVLAGLGFRSILEPEQPTETALAFRRFTDCADCPEMVILPRGSYLRGSPEDEPGRSGNEGPQTLVNIDYDLAVSVDELSLEQWQQCVEAGVCVEINSLNSAFYPNEVFDRMPVANINWDHAQDYLTWLSGETGFTYRLLSEAEWEYAARAGSTTAYPWGETLDETASPRQPNAWGLVNTNGGVMEWVADCYEDNYTEAPNDGRAVINDDCLLKVIRSDYWENESISSRTARRSGLGRGLGSPEIGFRVARVVE